MAGRRKPSNQAGKKIWATIAEIQEDLARGHYGFGWCSVCGWQHCAGEHDESKRHEANKDAHVCAVCGEPLQDLPPF